MHRVMDSFLRNLRNLLPYLLAIYSLPSHASLAYEFLNPVVLNGIRDAAPIDGNGDSIVGAAFIARSATGQNRAVTEFDLAAFPDRKLIYAVFSGQLIPNDSTNTGIRIQKLEAYVGNGTIELSDYSAPGTELGTIHHFHGTSQQVYVEFTDYLQSRLAAHAGYLGMRISPISNPMGLDRLNSPYIEYATYPMGGNTVRCFPQFDVNVSAENGPYTLIEGQGGINVNQIPFLGVDRRGVLEYDISSIPTGATITGAKIMFEVNSIGGSGGIRVYGYAGDGAASIDDALQVGTQIGVGDFPFGETGTQTMDISTQFVQSLVGNSQYLGINLVGNPQGGSLGFYADEFDPSPFFGLPAQLFIQYTPVPEPATTALAALSIVLLTISRQRLPSKTQSHGSRTRPFQPRPLTPNP